MVSQFGSTWEQEVDTAFLSKWGRIPTWPPHLLYNFLSAPGTHNNKRALKASKELIPEVSPSTLNQTLASF